MLGGASGAGTASGRRVQPGRVMPWTPQAVRKGLSRGTSRAPASRTFSPGGPRGPGSPLGPPRPLGPSGPSSPRGPGGPISPYRWESKGEGDATVPFPTQAGSEGPDPRRGVGAAGEPSAGSSDEACPGPAETRALLGGGRSTAHTPLSGHLSQPQLLSAGITSVTADALSSYLPKQSGVTVRGPGEGLFLPKPQEVSEWTMRALAGAPGARETHRVYQTRKGPSAAPSNVPKVQAGRPGCRQGEGPGCRPRAARGNGPGSACHPGPLCRALL